MVVRWAKLQTSVSLMKNIRSFEKKVNKAGPNIDPCGTPLRISGYELNVDPVFTCCRRFVRLLVINAKAVCQNHRQQASQ